MLRSIRKDSLAEKSDGTVFVTGPAPDGHVHYVSLGESRTDEHDGHSHGIARGVGRTEVEDGHDHALPEAFTQANKSAMTGQLELSGEITKIDEDQRLASGWFSVIEENGVPVVDLQGDVIDEADLVKAVHQFNLDSRRGHAMHKGEKVSDLVESIVFTRELQKALGIDLGKVGWFATMKVHDDATWAAVKSGKLRAFSIGGRAVRVPIAE